MSADMKMLSEICLICFSLKRKSIEVSRKHIYLLKLLLEDPTFELDSLSPGNSPPRLCYECERRLNNVLLFKTLVAERMTIFKMYLCNENQDLLTHKPTLVIEDTTYLNMSIAHHNDYEPQDNDEREMSPDTLEENIIDIKCEIEEVPIEIEENNYYAEIIAPTEMKTELTIDKQAQITIDNPSCQQVQGESNIYQAVSESPNKELNFCIGREIPQDWESEENRYMIIWASDDEARTWYESEKHKYTNTGMVAKKYSPRLARKRIITRCKMCNTGFESLSEAYEHHKEHYIHYGCKMCNYKSRSFEDVKLHCSEYQHSENDGIDNTKYMICRKCGMAFTKETHQKRHRIQCYGHRYPCEYCGKSFFLRAAKDSHILLYHKKMDVLTCDICNKKYDTKMLLRAHKRSHTSEERNKVDVFYCGPCDAHFKTKSSLTHHLRTSLKHIDKDELYKKQCPHCPAKWPNSTKLRRHVHEVHLGIKVPKKQKETRDIVCEICGMNFKTNQVLIHHMRKHSSDRPFKCDQCSATFKFPAALYTHNKLVHLKVKRNVKKKKKIEEKQDDLM